jgi:DNA-binding transcriptional LysR family regulator
MNMWTSQYLRGKFAGMDVDVLKMFLSVAQQGSCAAVTRDFGIDPTSVSRGMALLEAELGIRLFQRSTRAMVLTEAGERYRSHIAPLIEELDRAKDDVTASEADPSGIVRLTASVAFGQVCLVPLLPTSRESYPRLQFEMLLTDANLDFVTERIDIALRLGPDFGADLIGVKLFPTRYRAVASAQYVCKTGRITEPSELTARNCLRQTLPDYRSRWLLRRGSLVEEVLVTGSFVISSPLALRQASLDGLGPALLPNWLIDDDLSAGPLIDLFPGFEAAATSFETGAWLLYPSRSYMPRKVIVAIDFLRANLPPRRDKIENCASHRKH